MSNTRENLSKLTPIRSGEFGFHVRSAAREDFFKDNPELRGKVAVEVDHIIPRYMGGEPELENSQALLKYEHALKHVISTYFPELEQKPDSEWFGARQVISRLTKEEFGQFLVDMEPLIPSIKDWLSEINPPTRK